MGSPKQKKYFSTLNLRSTYHQIRVKESNIEKIAFTTRYGQFEYLETLFGLCGAPGCFESMIYNIFQPYLDNFIFAYLDDILIYSYNEDGHLNHLDIALRILRNKT